MARPRKKPYSDDELLHAAIRDIMIDLRPTSSGAKGFTLSYFGRIKDLKRACTRILNIVERIEEGAEDEKGFTPAIGR